MASKAEATAIIIDVSPSMNVAPEGEETPLQKCITAVNMLIQRKIFTDTKKNKDEAALILFGTEGTNNELRNNFGPGSYEHITISKELGVMDLDLLKFVNDDIIPGPSSGDFVDALVVALDHLNSKCKGRKMEQKVVLFSTLCCEFNADKLDGIINGIKANNVNLVFVGPEVEDSQRDDDNQAGPSHGDGSRSNQKPLTKQQMMGVKCVDHILHEVDGDGVSINEVLPMLSYFEVRRKKQVTTFRGAIEIGPSLKINVYSYVKVKEERPASWKKLSALAEHAANRETMSVDMQRTHHLNDEDQTEVEKENVAQAYRYGKTIVPMTSEDQKSMKLQTTKGCMVLGFTSRQNVLRHFFTRDTCHIFTSQPEDEHAAIALSALCHALEEKNMVAIVRYVSRGNTDPKIGFLTPHIKSSYESLIFIALPYREDVRTYMFPPLEGGKNNKPPTDEQNAAMDSLIDDMMLVEKSVDDDEGMEEVEEEMFKPNKILNPVNQRQCQCVQSRALNPEESNIPDVEEYILRSLKAVSETKQECQASLNKIKEGFPLEEAQVKKTASVFTKDQEEDKDKKPRDTATENVEEFTFGSLTRNQVAEVGLTDPIEDFKFLIENADREKVTEVHVQMSNVIKRLVMDSFLNQHYQKALECMQEFRLHCIKIRKCREFNKMLIDLKDACVGKRRQDFWDALTTEPIYPINKNDADDSTYLEVESKNFFKEEDEEMEEEKEPTNPVEEDADDLLDLL